MDEQARFAMYGVTLIAAGLGSGFAGGLFGIGGGVLRIPIFLYLFPLFGMENAVVMHMAAGTSLALAVPTGLRTLVSQRLAGNLDTGFVRSWIPALMVGVVIGLLAMRVLSGPTLILIFGLAMAVVATQMVAMSDGFSIGDRVPGHPWRDLMAATIGSLSTMIGVSGGAFTTPVLTIFSYPIHRALAVSAAGGVAISAMGAIGSIVNGLSVPGRSAWSLGFVDGVAVAIMLPAILISAPLGVKLANRLSEKRLRRVFGIFLFFVSADMLRQALVGG